MQISVYRYNPEKDSKPYMQDFQLEIPGGRDLMVLDVLELLKEQFDELYREGEQSGRLMNIGLHPHVAGHPYRIRALREFLEYAKGVEGVWWTTREQIADWYLEHHQEHIPSEP